MEVPGDGRRTQVGPVSDHIEETGTIEVSSPRDDLGTGTDRETPAWALIDWDRLDHRSKTHPVEEQPQRSEIAARMERLLPRMPLPIFETPDAEERAARAEEEARVLRRELERERAERLRLEQLVNERRVWRGRARRREG